MALVAHRTLLNPSPRTRAGAVALVEVDARLIVVPARGGSGPEKLVASGTIWAVFGQVAGLIADITDNSMMSTARLWLTI